jgi:hypothetical protein
MPFEKGQVNQGLRNVKRRDWWGHNTLWFWSGTAEVLAGGKPVGDAGGLDVL